MNARETNKELNRQKILAAARNLLLEGGIEALAMRSLAARAKVSSRTPYNLFGSKTEVLLGLIDEPLYQLAAAQPPHAGNRIVPTVLAMVEHIYAQYAPDIDYYRTIYWGVMSSDNHAAREKSLSRGRRLFETLLRGAVAQGELRADTDPALLGRYVMDVIAGLLGLWAATLLSGPDLVVAIRRSMILCFLGYAAPDLLPELTEALAQLDRKPDSAD